MEDQLLKACPTKPWRSWAGAEGFEPPGAALEAARLAINERPYFLG